AAVARCERRDGVGDGSERSCQCNCDIQHRGLWNRPAPVWNRGPSSAGTDAEAEMKKETGAYALRLPKSLKRAVEELSKEDGTSINQFVTTAVAEKVSALKTSEFFAV